MPAGAARPSFVLMDMDAGKVGRARSPAS